MLLLTAMTDKLDLVTSSGASIDVHVSYVELTTAFANNDMGRQNTNIVSATTTDIMAAPSSAGRPKNCKNINIRNKDAATACTVTVRFNQNATIIELYKELLNAGEVLTYFEGIGWFKYTPTTVARLMKVLTADDTGGQTVNTAQPWFPTTGSLTVPSTTSYRMTGLLKITTGATSHTTAIGFGGTATLTSIGYYAQCHRSAADTLVATFAGINVIAATAAVVDAAGTQAATYVQINGIIRINAGGTLIPQFTFSANPTGTITVKKDSFFMLEALGDNTFATAGTWA